MMETTFEALEAGELAEDEAWWELYEQAFPACEREPREVILRSVRQAAGIAVRARSGDSTVGLATAHVLTNPPAVFLVYLATSAHLRGHGHGSALLRHIWELGSARLRERGAEPVGMIWEIDDPHDVTLDQDADLRRRRLEFFRRNGGELLQREYFQPPVDGIAPVRMRLMLRPAADGALDEREIEALVRAIYSEKYHAINGIPEEILESLFPHP